MIILVWIKLKAAEMKVRSNFIWTKLSLLPQKKKESFSFKVSKNTQRSDLYFDFLYNISSKIYNIKDCLF